MRVVMIHPPSSHFSVLMSNLARGIDGFGDELTSTAVGYGAQDADALICWGWRRAKLLRRANPKTPILVMERGYVGDRFHWTSLGWNGLNGRAVFPKPPSGDMRLQLERWVSSGHDAYWQPWRGREGFIRPGDYALILGQVPGDQACVGHNLPYLYRAWMSFLQRHGYTVKFRPHPKALGAGSGLPPTVRTPKGNTLAEDLAGAKFTVSLNSNSSVDSVLAGVPSVTLDEGAMAWPVTSHDLDNPVMMPSRTEWAAQLAWCQWSPEELLDGTAWTAVREAMP
jgi:hypothetical protein